MRILVTGGTGTVGSQVVSELTQRQVDVSVLTRDASKSRQLPKGVSTVEGDLTKPETVRRVFDGIDSVFLLNAVSPTEAHQALLALTGMRDAGVKRIVYVSVQHADRAAWLPHFGSKVGVEQALKISGVPFTILRPSNFFQNDSWFKDVILQYGVYPQPLGSSGVSRVDVRDIAEAAAITLTSAAHEGKTFELVGPEPLTGEACARIWSQALGRQITYAGDDLDAWEKQQLQYLPDWLVYDFRMMFAFFQEHGLKASDEDIRRQTDLLGHAPRAYQPFVEEAAAAWQG